MDAGFLVFAISFSVMYKLHLHSPLSVIMYLGFTEIFTAMAGNSCKVILWYGKLTAM